MLYLWIFGNNVEDRLGRVGFLVFYLVGRRGRRPDPGRDRPGLDRSRRSARRAPSRRRSGAYLVLFPRARITSLVFLGFFYQLIDVPAVVVLVFWFVLQLIDGLASLGVTDVSGGVAFFAHIGGFVFGAVVGARRPRGRPA